MNDVFALLGVSCGSIRSVFVLLNVPSGKSVKTSKVPDVFWLSNDSSGKPVKRYVAAVAVSEDSGGESVERNNVFAVLDDSRLDSSDESVEDNSDSGVSDSSIRESGDQSKRGNRTESGREGAMIGVTMSV